jgi:hypothetical protein
MKVIRVVLRVLLILLLVYSAVNVFIPASFRVQRYVEVDASKKDLYNYLRDLNNYKEWSPWLNNEQSSEVEINGEAGQPESCVTYSSQKSGNAKVTVQEIIATKKVTYTIDFSKHKEFKSAYFTMQRLESGKTLLAFGVKGKRAFPFRLFNLMADKETGPDIEKGLNAISRQSF